MIRITLRVGVVMCLGALLIGCAQYGDTSSDNSQAVGGTLIGGLLGAGLGAGLGAVISGSGTGALLGAAAGGFTGAVAGGLIGHQLDARDKARRAAAVQQSMANTQLDQQTAWTNPDTGDSGSITPLSTTTDSPGDKPCREFNETYTRNGQTFTQKSRACLQPDGTWMAAQS